MGSQIDYLLSLQAVRERAQLVFEQAKQGRLNHFEYDETKMPEVADRVVALISRDFGPDKYDTIPPHGRWQHFNVGDVDRVSKLLEEVKQAGADDLESTRRLIDLFFVSVLLDAGAGDVWKFTEPGSSDVYNRSEGIAVASLYMFKADAFTKSKPGIVDAQGLISLQTETFNTHFQVSAENTMVGVESRVQLLRDFGKSLSNLPDIFGESGRPGNLVDYIIKSANGSKTIDYSLLWTTLQRVMIPSWPKNRTHINGTPIGDAWPLKVLSQNASNSNDETSTIQPFHKLTQWLAYSLMVPFVRILNLEWTNAELGTGLPEYRNGGLFYDLGALRLKTSVLEAGKQASKQELPLYDATGDVIVEWRAMTVALLDELYGVISKRFEGQGVKLSMAQMLEAGTWKCGRVLAAEKRPQTKSSPILIAGDGTLF